MEAYEIVMLTIAVTFAFLGLIILVFSIISEQMAKKHTYLVAFRVRDKETLTAIIGEQIRLDKKEELIKHSLYSLYPNLDIVILDVVYLGKKTWLK